ncbi:aldehyde dehydrogenase family protein [Novosphingobium pentaromativorans]|nr:aldehyde dehydrogenase family protein [Novosphingobium pentaromativorans]
MAATQSHKPLIELAGGTSQFIDGKLVRGEGEAFTVENPSDGSVVESIAAASIDQVREMIAAAGRAQVEWAALSRDERIAALRPFVAALRARMPDMRETLIAEAGCPGGSAPSAAGIMYFQTHVGVKQADDTLDLYRSMPEWEDNPVPLEERTTALGQLAQSVMHYSPVGVVAAIAAYNYPFYTAIWKVIPALATGNAVILRPSPLTPISSLVFAQAAIEAGLPAGVLNVMIESGIEGAQLLTTDPGVDMVAFTGSTAVGVQVAKQGADTMKRLQLELGGKSAQIFMEDALDKVIPAAAGVCLSHAGQGCVLGTRIFVPEERKAEVMQGMKALFESVKIGPASADDTVLGPLISRAQVERCERFVELATQAGAKVVCGGKRPEGLDGYFYEATVLDTPDNANPAAQEEIFGPVICVIGYTDIDHAIAMANDTPFGLSGYVFGADKKAALAVAKRLKTGTVNVNGGLNSAYASSGGHRMSGVGRERGPDGLRLYQNATNLTMAA